MENGGIKPDEAMQIISTTTSGGRSGHLKMLAAALAASATSGMGVRDHDPDYGMRVSGGWQYGQTRTSGQGVQGAAKARNLRKVKKKMRQQSRKK